MNLDKHMREVKDTDFVLNFIRQKRKICVSYLKEGLNKIFQTYFDEDRRIVVSDYDNHIAIYHGGLYSLGHVDILLKKQNIECIIYDKSKYECRIYYKNGDIYLICY